MRYQANERMNEFSKQPCQRNKSGSSSFAYQMELMR